MFLFSGNLFLECFGYDKCMVKYEIPMCYPDDDQTVDKHKKFCRQIDVCRKNFNISYIKMQPYNTLLVEHLVHTCCGNCTRLVTVNTFHNITQVTDESANTSHFIFPVLGRYAEESLYNYHFIPLVKVPSLYHITAKADNVLDQLLDSCLRMWPVLIILILMVAISGFIAWALETGVNKEEFPRSFLIGWFEGFWWSFITMSTVGYGDKTPKTIGARLFCVAWILVGLTTFSMLTGKLTFEISRANSPLPPEVQGARVAALRHRTYDALHIATRGGILIDVKKENDIAGIFAMIRKLRTKEIDGFVLDRYTFITFSRYVDSIYYDDPDPEGRADIKFLQTKTIQTEEIYEGEKLSYGVLVNHLEDYIYFADFIRDNWEVLNTCDGLNINSLSWKVNIERDYTALFDTSAGFFWPSLITSAVIIVAICFFGFGYEVVRKRVDKSVKGPLENNENNV